MYICIVRLIKQIINNKNKNSMLNQVMNSQSTEARNSAVESNANVVKQAKKIVKAAMKKANESNIIYKSRNDGAGRWYVTAELPTESNSFSYNITVERIEEMMGMSSTWSRITRTGNGDMYVFQNVLLDAVCDCLNETLSKLCSFFNDLNERMEERNKEAEAANNAAEVSEAPSLDEAPSLEDDYTIEEVCDGFYEIVFNDDEEDDITEEGYSVRGLNYLRETMVDADIEDIVDEAYEEVSNDLYVWLNELFRCGECPKNEFMDTMWAYAWDIIRDRGLSDEALEAETRYYTEFDDIVERRLEEWGLYERYNKIYMERAYTNR